MSVHTIGSNGTVLDCGLTGLGDIGSNYQDITFKFTDSNTNYTPQARIRARVAEWGGSGDSQETEGSGQLEFYCSTGTGATSGTETLSMLMGHNGNCAIGGNNSTNPGYKLKVYGTLYSSGSSREYKENISDYIPNTSNLANLRPVTYDYKSDYVDMGYKLGSDTTKQIGLIAEEVATVYPELTIKDFVNVEGTETNDWQVRNVDYQKLTIILLAEVQKLRAEVDILKG
jgi:hypothetical protein